VGAHTAILIPHGQVLALDILSKTNGLVANMPPIHNSWGIEKAHQLRIRDAKQIAQLSGFIEAAQREISDDPHFSKAALRAHQRLI
jgi:AraC family transcriptional activator of pobA